jgi:tryptophan-rich sensory protein
MHWISLLLWLGICFTVAGIGGWLTADEVTGWYRTLTKPAIAPPTWVYGPVWTLLYALMAIAAWQVWQSDHSLLRTRGITLFMVQLALNLAWSWMFFHEHEIGVALVDVILLWAVVGLTTLVFDRVAPSAAWLMLPYWAWLTFAAVLNIEFWRLNK